MVQRSDWLPSAKSAQFEMAQNWSRIIQSKWDSWDMPESLLITFDAAIRAAEVELLIPLSERNAVTNSRMNVRFRELAAIMRDMKRRYFYDPPLTEYDLVSLGLKPKVTISTPVLDPTGQAEVTITYPGRGQLALRISHVAGTQRDARAYYGYRIYYSIYDSNETLPESGVDLRKSKFTRRKTDLFTFLPVDSGKTACFCVRYENSKGAAGPWGPMAMAIIP